MAAALIEAPPGGGQLTFSAGDEEFLGAYLPLPEADWAVVVAASPTPVLMPLGRLHLYYWLFVLVLTVSTVVAFSMLTGPVTRSLQDLTRAAEEIGAGQLDPWLPPPGRGEVGKLTLAVSRMADRLREMMVQVERSGRLAVVGKLSAYLAHEIRNPLSSVKMNLQRLERWADRGEIPNIAAEPIEISLREVDRLAAAVTGVLQLSRPQDGEVEIVALHKVLQEARSLLQEKFRAQSVKLDLALDAGADRVLAHPGQIKSAVLNLMVNALEAQPGGGRLEVHSHLARRGEDQGPWIVLRFEDGGPGVPEEIRHQVFEPFFTTKPTGSGIGLAVAMQNIKENGGSLTLDDSEMPARRGASFVVSLPLAPVGTSDILPESGFPADRARKPPHWRTNRQASASEIGQAVGPDSGCLRREVS
jgi:signal transduction histidine kinase